MTVKPWTFQELAACKGMDLDGSFFSFKPEGIALAKKTCAGCPVKAECLDYAVANKIEFGVFGGLTDKERRPKRDRRR